MKAAFIKKTGPPCNIEYGELPIPKIKDNEVLIKVSAVAVNPIDTYIRSGKYTFSQALPTPFIIGCDAVGVVADFGSAVKQFKAGQRVWTNRMGLNGLQGTYAEYVAVDEDLVYSAPEHVDDVALVSVLQSGATACIGLIRAAMLKVSEIVFINGGAGNVGSAIIQLAVARGARVITATSGNEKMEWCKSLGAELVLDYKKDDFSKKIEMVAPDGVDVFWDTSRNPNFEISIPLMKQHGRIVLMAGHDAHPTLPVGLFYSKECTLKGFSLVNANHLELKGCAEIINRCLEDGKLKTKISEVMPLSEASRAHSIIESQPELWGKIVLKIS
ncbi:MAG: NADPH:quinone reductase [Parachlamydiaceae bacterium]|nr:NADPH:quinone reductase [Parachlamydiaceae bacterium]